MSINVNGAGAVQSINVQGLDLETAMMAVQSNRANLLEAQLKDQITSVQKKNDEIAKLNQVLGALNSAAATFSSGAKADDKLGDQSGFTADGYKVEQQVNSALISAGITSPGLSTNDEGGGGLTLPGSDPARLQGGIRGDVTKGKLDGYIQQVKSQIDGMSNSQQMDMLRLQSLSNKRNEAFDVMTNFIKKMQENRSSIIGNMR